MPVWGARGSCQPHTKDEAQRELRIWVDLPSLLLIALRKNAGGGSQGQSRQSLYQQVSDHGKHFPGQQPAQCGCFTDRPQVQKREAVTNYVG